MKSLGIVFRQGIVFRPRGMILEIPGIVFRRSGRILDCLFGLIALDWFGSSRVYTYVHIDIPCVLSHIQEYS